MLRIPGVGPLTCIDTDYGRFPAQALRPRDRVRLRSGRFAPLVRVDRLLLDEAFLQRCPEAQPVLVPPGRLGFGLPAAPVLLAPDQALSTRQGIPETLCTARDLLRAGIGLRRPERFLTYVVLAFADPEDICAGGLWLRVGPVRAGTEEEEDG